MTYANTSFAKMTFAGAIKDGLAKYAQFKGVASRRTFWYWRLFMFLVSLIATVIDAVLAKKLGQDPNLFVPVEGVTALALLLPDLAVTARRLHDVGRSALLLLWQLLPLGLGVATISLFVTENPNLASGADPVFSPLLTNLTMALLFTTSAASVFFLVLLLSKTKTRAEGNKFAPESDGSDSAPALVGW